MDRKDDFEMRRSPVSSSSLSFPGARERGESRNLYRCRWIFWERSFVAFYGTGDTVLLPPLIDTYQFGGSRGAYNCIAHHGFLRPSTRERMSVNILSIVFG